MRSSWALLLCFAALSYSVFADGEPGKPPSNFEVTKWVFAVVGGLFGFIPTAIYSWFKIRAVRAEILSKRIELIEKVGSAEQNLSDAQIEARKFMQEIGSAWQANDNTALANARENLSAVICDKIILRLKAVCELTVQRWNENPFRQLQFVNTEVRDSVNDICSWINDLVNHPEILRVLQKEPLIIKRSTVVRLHDIALECNKSVRNDAENTMKSYIERLSPPIN